MLGPQLREFGKWLGQFPSMVFFLAYLAAIPTFACIYLWMPYDFYNSTARFEPLVSSQKRFIESELRKYFLASIRDPTQLPFEVVPDDVLQMFTVAPQVDGAKVTVRFLTKDHAQSSTVPIVVIEFTVTDNAVLHPQTTPPKPDTLNTASLMSVEAFPVVLTHGEIKTAELFPCKGGGEFGSTCLPMTFGDYFTLASLSDTERGFPTGHQRSFWRMLYFSSVTMSTLGYGDIVPITTRARLIVTFQVILGPVLFALFLNALVNPVTKERPNAPASTTHG